MLYSNQKVGKKELFVPVRALYFSLKSGVIGFTLIFFLILVSKLLLVITVPNGIFTINFNDIILSSWGFLIFSFIVFAVNNKRGK